MNKNIMKYDYFKNKDLSYSYDHLCNILNREEITNYIDFLLKNKTPFSFAICDIDNFKLINDNYGHLMGDYIIKSFASSLENYFIDTAVVGRFGGDEFIIVIENEIDYDKLWTLFHGLNKAASKFNYDKFKGSNITITTGISRSPLNGITNKDIFLAADKALYTGKAKGRNCFIVYNDKLHKDINTNTDNKVAESVVELSARIFDTLSNEGKIKTNLENLLRIISNYIIVDELIIESNNKICVRHKSLLYDKDNFIFIPTKLMEEVSSYTGIFSLKRETDIELIKDPKLKEIMKSQGIKSSLWAHIFYKNESYGFIRAEMSSKQRTWQSQDLELLLISARTIALFLHFNKKNLDEIGD